ncbi:hypothetical protein AVEN_74878-1, partial [Araneus ventricosus]
WSAQKKVGNCWPSGKVLALGFRSVPGSKFDSIKDPSRVLGMLKAKSYDLPLVWRRSLEKRALAQVPSSSSDRGSKLRGPSPK